MQGASRYPGRATAPFLRALVLLPVALALLVALAVGGAWGQALERPDHDRSGWQPGPEEAHPNRLIVRVEGGSAAARALTEDLRAMGVQDVRSVSFEAHPGMPDGLHLQIVTLPERASTHAVISQLSARPGIRYVEPDYKVYKAQSRPVIPGDPLFPAMWGLHNESLPEEYWDPEMVGNGGIPVDDADIDMPEAWTAHTSSPEVVVAVIDSGAYVEHPDLVPNLWVNEAEFTGTPGVDDDGNGYVDDIHGWDFFNDDNTLFDPEERDMYGFLNAEHGTHTAGTIGAVTENGLGVSGINWDIQIMVLKFLGPDGGFTSDAILALEYAVNNGAMITSNSWGGGPYSQALKDTIEASNVLFVAAAGNSGVNTDSVPHYPSSYDSPNIISVAASMQNEERAVYPGWWASNYGVATVDLFAPGGHILSTIPPDPPPGPGEPPQEAYEYFYGTSMATPHVAGVAAALISQYPDLPQYPGAPGWFEGALTVKDAILNTVDVKPSYQGLVATGGRLNAAQAFALSVPPVISGAGAEPETGKPPLEVTFSGAATDRDGEVVDVWWEFGDGSEPVHEASPTHTYTEVGEYTATFHALDDAGLESTAAVTIRVFYPPEIGVEPAAFDVALDWDQSLIEELTLTNTGQGELSYSIQVWPFGVAPEPAEPAAEHLELLDRNQADPRRNPPQRLGSGGPDVFGYTWVDSDEPNGPPFQWRDISQIGQALPLDSLDDSAEVALPFPFPFYGEEKSSVVISDNGYLTFGTDGTDFTNDAIPDPVEPNDLIAVFWDDMDLREAGTVYAWGSAEEGVFIVQYQEVPRFFSGERYTFQVILNADGGITFQYLTMEPGRLDEATIGIENAAGEAGLQVAFNQEYVHDGLAVAIYPAWITVEPSQGTVEPEGSETVEVTFRAGRLPEGEYPATLVLQSNDPNNPEIQLETTLHVNALSPPIIAQLQADPWAGSPPLEVQFTAEVRDVDGAIASRVWDFGDGSDPVEQEPVAGDVYQVVHLYEAEGEYDATLTVTDDEGLSTSRSVHLLVQPLPAAVVEPPSFKTTVRAHRSRSETLTITNEGDAELEFTLATGTQEELPAQVASPMEPWDSEEKDAVDPRPGRIHPAGFGGPDVFGYVWQDSDELSGPVFDWVDLTSVGTPLDLGVDDSADVNLPWPFPFYGQEKTQMKISSNGYLTFGADGTDWSNDPIPNTLDPNDLLAVWWDDLNPSAGGEVYHRYDEANDRFVVEWHEIPRYSNNGAYTFEAILYPDGRIVYQYLEMDFAPGYEDDATVGIENAEGTDGLEVLFNAEGYIRDGLAIHFYPFEWLRVSLTEGVVAPDESLDVEVTFDLTPIGAGPLTGELRLETNDLFRPEIRVPIAIDVLANQPPVIDAAGVNPSQGPLGTTFQFVAAAHDPDGSLLDPYWEFGDGSDPVHAFVVEHDYAAEGEYTAIFHAIDNDGYRSTQEVTVRVADPPAAAWSPTQLFLTVAGGQSVTADLTLTNAGPGELIFGPGEGETGDRVPTPPRLESAQRSVDPHARSARGLLAPNPDPSRSPWLPAAVGDVLASWPVPAELSVAWGVGVDRGAGDLVLSDPETLTDHRVTPDGGTVKASWPTPWAEAWPGDLAFDGEALWQVNVGGDNGLYRLDPQTGEVLDAITSVPWTISQRGLAYNPNDDTFYVGGWNEDIVYQIAGSGWAQPGELIDSWSLPVGIAGLAFHPRANLLVVASNAEPDMIYFVDPSSRAILAQFPHPAGDDFSGAGIDFDADGNLWVASQEDKTMYLLETGLGAIGSWLTWQPLSGTVPAGGTETLAVTADARQLSPGVHRGSVVLVTNDLEYPLITVPVELEVAAPPVIAEATADPVIGEPPLEVTFHARVEAPETPLASYGWDFGDGDSAPGLFETTHTYTAEGDYLATFTVTDQLGGATSIAIPIEVRPLPKATHSPQAIETTLPAGASEEHAVTVSNEEGNAPLTFRVRVRDGSAPEIALPRRVGTITDPNAPTAHGLYAPVEPESFQRIAGNVRPDAVGDIVGTWALPAEISVGWGVGFDRQKLWISDPEQLVDFWTTTAGEVLGQVETPWAGAWPADLAYDPLHDLVWQVNVGGDNGLYGLDPQTGEVVASITSVPWLISQRGVAYNEEDDTFYVGGWNEDVIYRIKGLSWDNPGEALEAWTLTGAGISGLAWHPDGILWVATNSPGDFIYGLDLEAVEIVYQFPGPAGGEYQGAGLALNADGNLWTVTQDGRAWLISTEMPLAQGIAVNPISGTVDPGESMELAVTLNAAELGLPGDHLSSYLEITTNDPFHPLLTTDVRVHILPGPHIAHVQATPQVGEPPLEVSFAAEVSGPVSPIVDLWWTFGDGSESVHDTEAVHTYTEEGVYRASFHAVDENGVEAVESVEVQVRFLPVLEVSPGSFQVQLIEGEQVQQELAVANTGNAAMNFWITTAPSFAGSPEYQAFASRPHVKGEAEPRGWPVAYGRGGPDGYGYIWTDSTEEHGPRFDWVEISQVGTPANLTDDAAITVDLPWSFPFYGEAKSQITITDNGYLTFGPRTGGFWSNAAIPDPNEPNDLIAPFWDDLDPESGNIYYHYDEAHDRFVVQYQEMIRYGTDDTAYTFQVILSPNGTILFQYQELTGPRDSATVGIENGAGTDGLQVVYNAPYLEENLAVALTFAGSLVDVNPESGYLVPGETQRLLLTFGRPDSAPGRYPLTLHVMSDDPFRPQVSVPVDLEINGVPRVSILTPAEGTVLQGEATLRWHVQDDDATLIDLAYSADGGQTWNTLAEGMEGASSFVWETSQVPAGDGYRLRVRATDPEGLVGEAVSGLFTIHRLPAAEIREPQGGVVVTRPAFEIRWSAEDPEDGEELTIHLYYAPAEDGVWRRIALNLENTGSYIWNVAGVPTGDQVRLRMVVSDSEGGTVEVVSEPFTVTDAPVAAFSFAPGEAIDTGTPVAFIDASTDADGTVAAWSWSFGDGAASQEPNPAHLYGFPGIYHPTLTVVDDLGATSAPFSIPLAVGTPEAPVIGFATADLGPGEESLEAMEETGLVASKSGPGSVRASVARFGGDPVEAAEPFFQTPAGYFDLNLNTSQGVDRLTVRWHFPEGIESPDELRLAWFDREAGEWVEVTPQTLVAAPGGGYGGYITFTLDENSTPTLAQLKGTLFGVGRPIPNRPPEVVLEAPEAGVVWTGEETIRWTASDPDDDVLEIDLSYSGDDGATWAEIATGEPNDGEHRWDTSQVPDGGIYRVKVEASDGELSAEAVSDPMVVVKVTGDVTHGPNPAMGEATFYFGDEVSGTLVVLDASGRRVWSAEIVEGTRYLTWDLRNDRGEPLASGLYLYVVVLDDGTRSPVQRLVIER